MAQTPGLNALETLTGQPWIIRQDWHATLRGLSELVTREGITAEDVRKEIRAALEDVPNPSALAASLGDPLEGSFRAWIRDGVAILTARGPMFQYANFFTDVCGATAYEMLAHDFALALAHPGVRGIILRVNTPGGDAFGVSDLAEMFFKARGVKPFVAFVEGQCCSAGYWLASAVGRIVVADVSWTGCLGAVVTYRRLPKGEVLEIVSEQTPRKRTDLDTPEGIQQAQSMVNDLADVFLRNVARYMGVPLATVLKDFGEGAVFVGQKAVDAGLVHGVGTFEDVLAEMVEEIRASSGGTPAIGGFIHSEMETNMADQPKNPAGTKPEGFPATLTAAQIAEHYPEAATALRGEGAAKERERIQGIEAQSVPGAEKIITSMKADPAKTGADAALAIVAAYREGKIKAAAEPAKPEAEGEPGASHLDTLRRMEQETPKPGAGAVPPETTPEAAIDAEVRAVVTAGQPTTTK